MILSALPATQGMYGFVAFLMMKGLMETNPILLFGLGICICRIPLAMISGERYRNCANLLSVPLIATCMLLPLMASGWLVSWLGYHQFFLLNTLTAPICWLLIKVVRR